MKLLITLQCTMIAALLMLCYGLYQKGNDPYMDFFPMYNKPYVRAEAYKAGCIMWSMKKNKGALVMRDWQECLNMADEFNSQDYRYDQPQSK